MNNLKLFPGLFTFTCILLACSFSIAQTNMYHPFPDSNAVWRVDYGGYQAAYCANYQYIMAGDTLVDSLIYHKIRKQGYINDPGTGNFCPIIVTPLYYFDDYEGAIREDTILRRVYFLPSGKNRDTLLYDFNLKVGDTVVSYLLYSSDAIVKSIDSILVGTKYRKRIKTCCLGASLIEGIGSTNGLLEKFINFENGGDLICFRIENNIVYGDTNCSLITSIESNIKTAPEVKIELYPNPIYDVSVLKLEHLEHEFISLEIYNTFGVLIKRDNIKGAEKVFLSKQDFPQGIFIYKLISDKGIFQTGIFITQ